MASDREKNAMGLANEKPAPIPRYDEGQVRAVVFREFQILFGKKNFAPAANRKHADAFQPRQFQIPAMPHRPRREQSDTRIRAPSIKDAPILAGAFFSRLP